MLKGAKPSKGVLKAASSAKQDTTPELSVTLLTGAKTSKNVLKATFSAT